MPKEAPYIGQMKNKVTVFRVETVPNEMSEHKATRVDVAHPWAQRNDTGGSQVIEGSVQSVVNRSYIIRLNKEIAENGLEMFVQDGAKTFAIHAIKEIGKTHLELLVREHE